MSAVQKTVYSDPLYDYLQYARNIRGSIINDVAEMERMIDNYIAEHFCHYKKRKIELLEVIVSTKHLTYQSKADILRFIVERRGDATKKEAKQIWEALMGEDKIAYHRNILAHCELDTSRSSINTFKADQQTIQFIKFSSNTKKTIVYTKKEVVKLLELIFAVKAFFKNIIYERVKKRHTSLIVSASTKQRNKS